MNQLTIVLLMLLSQAPSQVGQDPAMLPRDVQQRLQLVANWESMSTPGTKMEMREIGRGTRGGKLMVGYEFQVTGASTKEPYTLMQWSINESQVHVVLPEGYVSSDGRFCGIKQSGCPVPIQLAFLPAQAEPFRMILMNKGGKTRIAAMVVPDPIIATDQGCSLEAVRATVKFEAAVLRGRGFKPKEKLAYQSNSAGEIITGTQVANEKGDITFVLMPSVKGKDSGTDEVTLKGADCAPTVKYEWGVVPK